MIRLSSGSTHTDTLVPCTTLFRAYVVEVLADGRSIAAKPSSVLFVGVDITSVTVQSVTYIYNISLDHLLFWKRPMPSDLSLVEYSIPEDTELLEIKYRSEERRVGKEGVSTCRSRWSA